ncbi:hypothetical protein BJX64DRAFT_192127 [Aspergillus heterothallicus]
MEATGHSNSTDLVHGHGHHHLPDLEGTRTSDEVIILILGAIVFLTFALGLAFQLCEKPVWLLRRKCQSHDQEQDNDLGQIHQMAELDLEAAAAATVTDPLLKPGNHQLVPLQWSTRYGAITQHHIDVGGVRKMVLVVEGDAPCEGVQMHDGYTQWFERWRGRTQIKDGVETTKRAMEETDLLGEDDTLVQAQGVTESGMVEESELLLEFDPDEEEGERSDTEQREFM